MSGWIKIHRKITEWEWYDDVNTFRLFMHLILKSFVIFSASLVFPEPVIPDT